MPYPMLGAGPGKSFLVSLGVTRWWGRQQVMEGMLVGAARTAVGKWCHGVGEARA